MGDEACAALEGVDGLELVGLRIGVVAPTGAPVLEGSWLAIGVISVPISLMDTDLAVEGGGINVVVPWKCSRRIKPAKIDCKYHKLRYWNNKQK